MITTDAYIKIEKVISPTLFLLSIDLNKYREWIPGMFLQLSLKKQGASEPWLDSRAFSIASWGDAHARMLIRKEGKFTTELIQKAIDGFETSIRYPFGDFLLNTAGKKVFIAGGAGISVFLSYLDYLSKHQNLKGEIYIFHSSRISMEIVSRIYWNSIPSSVHLDQSVTSSIDPSYTGRLTTERFFRIIGKMYDGKHYLCGPQGFVQYWFKTLMSNGLSVRVETWKRVTRGESV